MLRLGLTPYGYRWGIVFYQTDLRLSFEERLRLVTEATEMYLKKEGERHVRGDNYEGFIKTDGKRGILGSFVGRHFYAVVDVGSKRANLSFLVTEYVDPRLN